MENKKNPEAEFKPLKNGPLQVSGNFTIIDRDGNEVRKEEVVFLCRCGGSNNKPFCDGTHRKKGIRE